MQETIDNICQRMLCLYLREFSYIWLNNNREYRSLLQLILQGEERSIFSQCRSFSFFLRKKFPSFSFFKENSFSFKFKTAAAGEFAEDSLFWEEDVSSSPRSRSSARSSSRESRLRDEHEARPSGLMKVDSVSGTRGSRPSESATRKISDKIRKAREKLKILPDIPDIGEDSLSLTIYDFIQEKCKNEDWKEVRLCIIHFLQSIGYSYEDALPIASKYTKLFGMRDFDTTSLKRIGEGNYGTVTEHRFIDIPDIPIVVKSSMRRSGPFERTGMKEVFVSDFFRDFLDSGIIPIEGYKFNKESSQIIYPKADGDLFDIINTEFSWETDDLFKPSIFQISAQLVNAVLRLHTNRIVHRDIKPENILWSGSKVWLADFGLSIIDATTLSKERVGTPAYMAPEILFLDPPKQYGEKADIWSLGCVLALVAGKNHIIVNEDGETVGKTKHFFFPHTDTISFRDQIVTKILKVIGLPRDGVDYEYDMFKTNPSVIGLRGNFLFPQSRDGWEERLRTFFFGDNERGIPEWYINFVIQCFEFDPDMRPNLRSYVEHFGLTDPEVGNGDDILPYFSVMSEIPISFVIGFVQSDDYMKTIYFESDLKRAEILNYAVHYFRQIQLNPSFLEEESADTAQIDTIFKYYVAFDIAFAIISDKIVGKASNRAETYLRGIFSSRREMFPKISKFILSIVNSTTLRIGISTVYDRAVDYIEKETDIVPAGKIRSFSFEINCFDKPLLLNAAHISLIVISIIPLIRKEDFSLSLMGEEIGRTTMKYVSGNSYFNSVNEEYKDTVCRCIVAYNLIRSEAPYNFFLSDDFEETIKTIEKEVEFMNRIKTAFGIDE